MNELALFAGAGGGILGGHLLGWRTVCAVERNAHCATVLAQRQTDGILRPFPIWSDVESFDGRPWRGIVDVVSGGFPCTDISTAGGGDGIDGLESGLWREMARIVGEVRPRYVFVENSPALTSRGLGRVLGDLAALGFDAEWDVFSAADFGADHLRERIWIVADAEGFGRNEAQDQTGERGEGVKKGLRGEVGGLGFSARGNNAGAVRVPQSSVARIIDEMAQRVERVDAIGNGQVPRVAATAWQLLMGNTRYVR